MAPDPLSPALPPLVTPPPPASPLPPGWLTPLALVPAPPLPLAPVLEFAAPNVSAATPAVFETIDPFISTAVLPPLVSVGESGLLPRLSVHPNASQVTSTNLMQSSLML